MREMPCQRGIFAIGIRQALLAELVFVGVIVSDST